MPECEGPSLRLERLTSGESSEKTRREEEQANQDRYDGPEQDARRGDILRGLRRRMPFGRCEAHRELQRGVDRLEPKDEGDGQHEHRPLDVRDAEPCRKQHRRDADGELDPRVALGAKNVRDALEGVTERP